VNVATCNRKVAYDSERDARRVRKKMIRNGGGDNARKLEAYKCPVCGKYHLGH